MWGPFVSRDAAEYYQEEVLRLHQVRRCTEPLRPSAEHPGCIYGEMNQCLRPCQCAVSRDEYESEFGRLNEFLRSNGKTALDTLSTARNEASEKLDFEQAALVHKRIEQVKTAAAARDEIVTDVTKFGGVAVTSGPSASEVRLWPMLRCCWQQPTDVNVSAEQTGVKSLDADLKDRLKTIEASAVNEGDPLEHLSVFLRWYRSSWRDGAWLSSDSLSRAQLSALSERSLESRPFQGCKSYFGIVTANPARARKLLPTFPPVVFMTYSTGMVCRDNRLFRRYITPPPATQPNWLVACPCCESRISPIPARSNGISLVSLPN